MKKTIPYLIAALCAIALAISFQACGAPEIGTGDIALTFQDNMQRTFEPAISMDVDSYQVVISDDVPAVVLDTVVSGDTIFPGFLPGDYTIQVIGRNVDPTAIGEGSGACTVTAGNTESVNITVTEYAGAGTLDLDVSWTTAIVADPVIESDLAYNNDASVDISTDWTLGTDAADYFDDTLVNGYWTMVFRLFDDGAAEPSAGFATLARVVKDNVTSGSVALVPNATSGGIEILMDLDFYENLVIDSTVAEGTYDIYDIDPVIQIDLTPQTVDTVFYAWFRNGVSIGSTSSLTIDPAALNVDSTYRYDVIAITADGKKGGCLSWTYNLAAGSMSITINWTPADGSSKFHIQAYGVGESPQTWYDVELDFVGSTTSFTASQQVNYWICAHEDLGGNGTYDSHEYYEEQAGLGSSTPVFFPVPPDTVIDFGTIDF